MRNVGGRGEDANVLIQMFVTPCVPSVLLLLLLLLLRLAQLGGDIALGRIPTVRGSGRPVRSVLAFSLSALMLPLQLLVPFRGLGDVLPVQKLRHLASQYRVVIDVVIRLQLLLLLLAQLGGRVVSVMPLPLLLLLLLLHVVPMLPRIWVGHRRLHPYAVQPAAPARRGRGGCGGVVGPRGVAPQRRH